MRSLSMYVSKCSKERRQELGRRKLPESGGVQIVMEQKQDPSSVSTQTCCPREIPNGSWARKRTFLQEGQSVGPCYALRVDMPLCGAGEAIPFPRIILWVQSRGAALGWDCQSCSKMVVHRADCYSRVQVRLCSLEGLRAAVERCSRSWRAAAGTPG